jgi:glycosyltransferase involved in cell wall biosynthesis
MPLETSVGRFLEMSTVWMDRAIIASSTATRRIYERYWHTRGKCRLIHYGLPLGRFDPTLDGSAIRQEFHIGEKEQVVALIAYIEPPPKHPRFGGISNKGHEIFIQAAREIRRSRQQVKFLIVGDYLYPDRSEDFKRYLQNMVHQADLDEHIIFTGYRSDVPQIIAMTDIVVVPSQSENMGGAVEPLLMEKPVVASNVGGLPDVVIDGKTGFLVPPRDPKALADAVLRLLALPSATRREMGRRGRKIMQSLVCLQETVRKTESLYYELLEQL